MKPINRWMFLVLLIVIFVGCSPATDATPLAGDVTVLTISGSDIEQTYTLEQLQAMTKCRSESDDGAFVGVCLHALLTETGFELSRIETVRVLAIDGFSSTYEEALFTRDDAILAYSRDDGDLLADEQPLRMVIPGEEGRMQPRQVSAIEVVTQP